MINYGCEPKDRGRRFEITSDYLDISTSVVQLVLTRPHWSTSGQEGVLNKDSIQPRPLKV